MSDPTVDVPAARPLFGCAAVRAIDRATIDEVGLPGAVLMEQAGRAVAEAARALAPAGPVLVLCGGGNNGGDGYVAARWLRRGNVPVRVVASKDPDELSGDAAWAYRLWREVGGEVSVLGGDAEDLRSRLAAAADGVAAVIDALFGTGIDAPLRDGAVAWVGAANDVAATAGARVVAVDVPSGLDVDTGAVLGAAIRADVTVTIGFDKPGLRAWPGRGLAGEIRVVDLGYPAHVVAAQTPLASLLDAADVRWPARPADGHKGSFGTVGLWAGSADMPGALHLMALGALRAGAGKVLAYSEVGGHALLPAEAIRRGGVQPWAATSVADVVAGLDEAAVVALGPGLGRGRDVLALVREALPRLNGRPLVVDADALVALCHGEAPALPAGTVLTPHPGEAALLLGASAGDVQADRLGAARALVDLLGAVVVLKGAGTIVAAPGRMPAIAPFAAAALAVPGSGDVLAGVIAALLAQGCTPWDAACGGVWLHGCAASRLRPVGNLASEIAGAVADVLGEEIAATP